MLTKRRRKRDRLTLNMAVIDRRRMKLHDLPADLQTLVDEADAQVCETLDLRGMDTDDRTDLYLIGLGVTLLKQMQMAARTEAVRELSYEIVMNAILGRIGADA